MKTFFMIVGGIVLVIGIIIAIMALRSTDHMGRNLAENEIACGSNPITEKGWVVIGFIRLIAFAIIIIFTIILGIMIF
ncbi:hypothetical protein OFO10_03690 [Campylobacter sp. VBCF_06 NA8]|uniref:hypothetical protein n=1 Tax=Campylobacter sp. VBCF_06 NA8 TaxID=2983822 RepID=UPI0022E9FE51|nr:hypothetical protein [Campylobacter sp. VBCF_06 NA8]MDA3046251.1 hypothetical protein [Campylobacter sp. VBCF_06 NA8]